jgi:hypothetical protein
LQFCDHIEKIAQDIARAAELPCVLVSADSKNDGKNCKNGPEK